MLYVVTTLRNHTLSHTLSLYQVSNPLDLLKVRIQSSGGLGDVHYKADSGYQTFRSIVNKEGLKGLYRGTVISL